MSRISPSWRRCSPHDEFEQANLKPRRIGVRQAERLVPPGTAMNAAADPSTATGGTKGAGMASPSRPSQGARRGTPPRQQVFVAGDTGGTTSGRGLRHSQHRVNRWNRVIRVQRWHTTRHELPPRDRRRELVPDRDWECAVKPGKHDFPPSPGTNPRGPVSGST